LPVVCSAGIRGPLEAWRKQLGTAGQVASLTLGGGFG